MTRPEQELSPGFMVVHGNHPEALRDLMVTWMARHPLRPLEDELVLVQSNGVAQWLKLSLAAGPAAGGIGVAAALRTELPSRALWEAYRAVLGPDDVPPASALDKSQLAWRLMRLLPALLDAPAFEPLRGFLRDDDDSRKLHQLALRLADLLDQYQVYRADWLARWADSDHTLATSRGVEPVPAALRWQPLLWRALLADVGAEGAATSRADVHRRFLAAVEGWQGERPAGLPRRITVFGISSLPRQTVDVLAALARFSQVLLFVHNPCEHDWSFIVAEQDLLRRRRQQRRPGMRGEPASEALHLHAHPLLAAWGKQGRDFIRLLDEYDQREAYEQRFGELGQRIDLFAPNGHDSLLRQLQDDVRELRPLAETRELWPPVDATRDRSIVFHVAHGPQREVEILHDQLLAAFAADPTLRPRDVIVMVPDVAVYAPHVQAVFGLALRGDPRHIPYNVADQGQRQQDPLLGALEQLLHLPQARLGVTEVLDLLDVPALRARFGIAEDQLPLLERWIAAARIRWGLHAEHRQALDLPEGMAQNSWDFGLRRMLLGYAVGRGEGWNGIEPLDEIGGLDAALLGPLMRLHEALETHWRLLAQPAAPDAWVARLGGMLQAFFEARDGSADGLTLLRAQAALDDWGQACADADLAEPLPLSVVRAQWLETLEPAALRQPFFAGGVTFASLMPMRAIPFRRVALLGMNDGDYPRSRPAMDFDLMARDHRPGDRSRREDDRYLFLEALLSAREHLHVSWVGRSIHDNEERPPSVLVAQLRDHLAAGWTLAEASQNAGADLLDALTVQHRLQPFHPAYFDGEDRRLFTYAAEWRASHGATPTLPVAGALPPPAGPQALTVQRLGKFLQDPVGAFFEQRLGIHFERDDVIAQDIEPFALGGLDRWQLQDELIRVQRAALDAGRERDGALQAQLAHIAARGELPHGPFAAAVAAELEEPMRKLFDAYATECGAWPEPLPDEPLAYDAGDVQLDDWLSDLRGRGAERCRLVLVSSSLVKDGHWRFDKLLPHWAAHLAGHLDGRELTTIVLSKAGIARLQPLAPDDVLAWWSALLDAWRRGMCEPLPFSVPAAAGWLGAKDPAKAEGFARKGYDMDCEYKPALRRAFPAFEDLWGDDFRDLAQALLQPLCGRLGKAGEGAA
jgi:exodeoxyribonuclease V gamma subunit